MRAPVAIFLDDRVAASVPTEPDLEMAERGIEQVKYVREDVLQRLVRDAAGQAQQYPVSLTFGAGLLWALMSNGRIFMTDTTGAWEEYATPPDDTDTLDEEEGDGSS